MSIRFKFRSSVDFEAVETGGRPSLTVRELRQEVIFRKKLKNAYRDFDLVFFDGESGIEYDDDSKEVPTGSSVVIKRVPAGTARGQMAPIDAPGSFKATDLYPKNSVNGPMVKIGDFGIMAITDFNPEDEEDAIAAALRSGLSDSPKVQAGGGREVNVAVETRAEEQMKLQNTPAAKERRLNSEFKCLLCKTYLREAVMIPCCQNSFCNKCICQVLAEKGRCPKCSSDKCKVENLLPNLSLRKAVEHFRESQILRTASENAFNRYAPDGESGIHVIDAPCGVTVIQREPELPHSPTATGKGSNVILPELFYTSNFRTAGRGVLAPDLQKGENNMRQSNNYNEADSMYNRKREMRVEAGGGDGNFLPYGRQYMGNQTCYKCGSLDHFIRDCPFSSGPHPMPPPGHPSYLNRAVYTPFGSLPSMYGNPPMMPFNAPTIAYVRPPYVPNMYGGLPTGGMMRSGTFLTLEVNRAQHMPAASNAELEYAAEKSRKVSPDYFGRERNDNVEDNIRKHNLHSEPERPHEYRIYKEREASWNHGKDIAQRLWRKNHNGKQGDSDSYSSEDLHGRSSRSSASGRDQKSYPSGRSGSGLEQKYTRTDKHGKEGWSKHHDNSSKRHHGKRQQSRSDSSQGRHHQSRKEAHVRSRVDIDNRGSLKEKDLYKDSHKKKSTSGDRRRQQKDIDPGLEMRHSRHDMKHKNGHPHGVKQHMVSFSDEECGDDSHSRKRKRVH